MNKTLSPDVVARWKRRAALPGVFVAALLLSALITLVWRWRLMPFAGMAEVDVSLRIFSALGWIDRPYWPGDDFWLPLHRMLLGPWLACGPETSGRIGVALWFAVFWNILLLGALGWLARRMDRELWWIPLLAALISPLLLYQGFVPLADLPAATCLLAALAAALGAHKRRWEIILAVVFALMASMLRYEAWPALAVVILLLPEGRGRVVAALLLGLFPLMWMTGHYALFGDPLHGIHKAAQWQASQGWTAAAGMGEALSRMGFVSSVLLGGCAIPVALLGLWGMIRRIGDVRLRWIALLAVFLVLIDFWAVLTGHALLRSRYLIVPAILLTLFAGEGLRGLVALVKDSPRRRWVALAMVALLFVIGPRLYGLVVAEGLIPLTSKELRLTSPALAQSLPAESDVIMAGIEPMTAYTHALYLNGPLPGRVRIFAPGELNPCIAAKLAQLHPKAALVLPGGPAGSDAYEAWKSGVSMTIGRGVAVPKGPAILFYHSAGVNPELTGCQ